MTNIFDKDGNILPNIDVDSITEIEIPDWMTEVPDLDVFKNLTSVTIPDSITEIKDFAFAWCKSLSHISLPKNLISIGKDAFSGCKSLTEIEIPDSVTEIKDSAFYGCTNLSHIKLSNNLISIGENAFDDCKSLAEIEIPDSVTEIKDRAFRSSRLSNIKLSKNLASIGENAFSDNNALAEIEIPDSVTEIKGNAFYGCTNLSHIKLSKNLISIGEDAFSYSGLEELEIPDSVTEIKDRAFERCSDLSHIKLSRNLVSIGEDAFSGCKSLTEIEIPDSVTEIKDNAFDGCTSLSHIKLSNNVSSIGYEAFRGCEALTEIEIPETIQHIEEGAFSGCTNLQSITFLGSDSETQVDENAFDCCSRTLTIPLWNNISPRAFGGSRPQELYVIGSVNNPKVIEEFYEALNLSNVRFFAPWNGKTYFCDHGFSSDGEWMYDEKEQITFMLLMDHDGEYGDFRAYQLEMPNLPELYYGIFKDIHLCWIEIDTLIMPPSLKIIKRGMFNEEYIMIRHIILPSELKVIESFAFYHTGLKDITIPSSVWLIDNGALCIIDNGPFPCRKGTPLESIRFEGKVKNISAGAITETGEIPEGLKTIIVPKGLKEYYMEKLSDCKGIEDIIVEE